MFLTRTIDRYFRLNVTMIWGSGCELEKINYKFPYLHHIITILHHIPTLPRLIRFEREGMRRNYRGNIANEINVLGCITFATRYGVVVGVSF